MYQPWQLKLWFSCTQPYRYCHFFAKDHSNSAILITRLNKNHLRKSMAISPL